MDESQEVIAQRLKELRAWRQLPLRTTAELAGLSYSYVGQVERGQRPVSKRSTLEALAAALRVSPTELTGKPWTRSAPPDSDAHEALTALETALETFELGHDPGGAVRPWPELEAEIQRLQEMQHVHADYAGQGQLAPQLLRELHAAYVRDPQHRPQVLLGLLHCYSSACWATKRLGGRGWPALAARLAQQCAQELDVPQWRGYAAWLRGDAAGELSRAQQYARSVRVIDELSPAADDPAVLQACGMLHLSAALASAARADADTTSTHIGEAEELAGRMETSVGSFGHLWFGVVNVGIWKISLGTELGDQAQVVDTAHTVRPELIPSPSRQAEYWADLGRVQVGQPATREQGVQSLLHAERLAPQRVRHDVFVREAVADVLRRARRDASGREMRGLAYRMGVAPTT